MSTDEPIKRLKKGPDGTMGALERTHCRSQSKSLKQDQHVKKNIVHAHPSFLKFLGDHESRWIFGAIAQLVDNSRDAKATKLEISIEAHYSKIVGEKIPMLSIIDDGHGMSHQEITSMFCFGREQYDADDRDQIRRFGLGFKTGAMKLGRDVIVLTQTTKSSSIAFLSQSLNEGKDNIEIPIVTYCRHGSFLEVDRNIQSEASADYHLKAIKEFSPFNEYFIGAKFGLFGGNGKGTQIYIWNLEKCGSDFCLEWQSGKCDEGSSNNGDILIRSRWSRALRGINQKVPLDYSLRSYLEVIFLDPRIKIYIQGSLVKSWPLAKSLSNTKIVNSEIMGKSVQLTIGRCWREWQQMNCGIFLYWDGRLIEAYKRVGDMVYSAETGRGIIGVIDVTDLMIDENVVLVRPTKQAFWDCKAYAKLNEWLGHRSNEYIEEHFIDTLHLKWSNASCNPDHELVQCDKCRKWRIPSAGYNITTLPHEWVCCMPPYNGKCETPEEEAESGVFPVGAKRSRYHPSRCETPEEEAAGVGCSHWERKD